MPTGFSEELRVRTDDVWRAVHAHPFVRRLGDGTLARGVFEHYLLQDYAYLKEFSRVLAVAAAKADRLEDRERLSSLLRLTLGEEMELHRRTCASYGLDAAALEGVECGLATIAYSSHLLRIAYEGGFGEILAALLPCSAGYVEIATRLHRAGPPDVPAYRTWIETYVGDEMRELVSWMAARLDQEAADAAPSSLERWHAIYRTSARFELFFFEMAWRRETWPAAEPA
jgi:thiaminase/transcriptional activator TenA